jgi:hypothetical protein
MMWRGGLCGAVLERGSSVVARLRRTLWVGSGCGGWLVGRLIGWRDESMVEVLG